MSDDVFDPARHKIVAVDGEGQHFHVTLHEIKVDMQALPGASDERVALLEALVVEQEKTIQTLVQRLDDIAQAQKFIVENALARVELVKGAA